MNFIFEPSVYLVGEQVVAEEGLQAFLDDHGVSGWETDTEVGGEKLSEVAGRLCYMSFAKPRPGGNRAYLHHILEVGHGSVTEHAVWNIVVSGVSRSLTHELVRHRAGVSPSQLSQRYVDESVADFVVPPDLQVEVRAAIERFRIAWCTPEYDQSECSCLLTEDDFPLTEEEAAGVLWIQSCAQAQKAYRELADYLSDKAMRVTPDGATAPEGGFKTAWRKYARQAARSVLPNATETKIFLTFNARALRHFFELRASRHADPEIRKMAFAVWKVMVGKAPNLFGDYAPAALPDGTFELTTQHRKV